MTSRTARGAVEAFLSPLRRAVSCVTSAILVEGDVPLAGTRFVSLSGSVVRLMGTRPLDFELLHAFEIGQEVEASRPSWRARTARYAFEFRHVDGPMLLAYHWHPAGVSPITTPHLHLGGAVRGVDLSKVHLPTGHVSLQDVIRFAIIDLGVEPLRPDWERILARASVEP